MRYCDQLLASDVANSSLVASMTLSKIISGVFFSEASTYAMEVMDRVAPKNAPETAKEGAALAASRSAFAVSSVKTSTFASLVRLLEIIISCFSLSVLLSVRVPLFVCLSPLLSVCLPCFVSIIPFSLSSFLSSFPP